MNLNTVVEFSTRKAPRFGFLAGMLLVLVIHLPSATFAQDGIDGVTGFARDPIHVAAWPGGRKVAISFALFIEEFGFGQGPVFRPDLASRNPDLVNEAFRQYAIDWGIPRVGRLFKELDVPLTVVLNAEFPAKHASVWKEFRAGQPVDPAALSGGHGRHGPASRAHEDARRDRDALARLRAGVGRRGPRRRGARGDDGGHRNPSLRDRDARRGGRAAARSLPPQK